MQAFNDISVSTPHIIGDELHIGNALCQIQHLLLAVNIQLPTVHQSAGCFSQLLKLLSCQQLFLDTQLNFGLQVLISFPCMVT